MDFQAVWPDKIPPQVQPIGMTVYVSRYVRQPNGDVRLWNLSAEDGSFRWYQGGEPPEAAQVHWFKAVITSYKPGYNSLSRLWLRLSEGEVTG